MTTVTGVTGVRLYLEFEDLRLLVFSKERGAFQAPGGHIKKGETPEEAAARAIRKKLGLKLRKGGFVRRGIIETPHRNYYALGYVGDPSKKLKLASRYGGFVWMPIDRLKICLPSLRSARWKEGGFHGGEHVEVPSAGPSDQHKQPR